MKQRFAWMIILVTLFSLAFLAAPRPAEASSIFNVNHTADLFDISPGNGLCRTIFNTCTLRAAIQEANALPGFDTINVPAGTYTLARVGNDDTALNGDLDLLNSMTINGAGASLTIIDGNGNNTNDRVFHLLASVTISGVTVRNGKAVSGGGILVDPGNNLTLNDSIVSNNVATTGTGGGLSVQAGAAHLTRSAVSNNTAGAGGGGIFIVNGGLDLFDSTVNGNSAGPGSGGGGIAVGGPGIMTLNNSTIHNNSANSGGGILNLGTASLTNSTISGNSVRDEGGGIRQTAGLLSLYNVTIANNTADSDHDNDGNGGGIFLLDPESATFQNSIIAGNRDLTRAIGGIIHRDCSGPLTSQGYNLVQNSNGCLITGDLTGNLTDISPLLGPLQNNGSFTLTHGLPLNSPAVEAGNPNGCTDSGGNLLTFDQRGSLRHISSASKFGRCDMGSFEFNDFPA